MTNNLSHQERRNHALGGIPETIWNKARNAGAGQASKIINAYRQAQIDAFKAQVKADKDEIKKREREVKASQRETAKELKRLEKLKAKQNKSVAEKKAAFDALGQL